MEMQIPKQVTFIIDRLEKHGYEAYAVGGCVRDMLLGRVPNDWDITTSAKPEQVKAVFKRTVDTGIQHGTVTVLEDHIGFEVTTYRIDGEYTDGRHPDEVQFTPDLKEDLRRRDFTINAMAYSPQSGIVDVFGGQEDLQNGIIRCVGSAEERFHEDALRIMRAVRFAAQLGFSIEEETWNAVKKLAPNLKKISAERIQTELSKLLLSPHPECFKMLYETGITKVILPEFDTAMSCEQNTPYHCYSVGEHTQEVMNHTPCDLPLRLTGLLHDLGKPLVKTTDENGQDHFYGHPQESEKIARKILRRLKYDNQTIDRTCRLIRFHDYKINLDKKSVRRAVSKIGTDLFPDLLIFRRADAGAKPPHVYEETMKELNQIEAFYQEIQENKECTSLKMLAVTGKDLIEAGMKPGKELGETLERLLQHVLENPEDNQKDVLLKLV
ncbi:MAG: CCA tRNA nucleotidyltransferase [Lachnospiraceae bacterium]|nr:CCA tRNA nucleotidyltransferase [Lachnospiraceae bacterium]